MSQAHTVQLEAFALAIKKLRSDLPRPKLQFVGSCRNKSDEDRLQSLKDKAVELEVEKDVEFHKNIMYRLVAWCCFINLHMFHSSLQLLLKVTQVIAIHLSNRSYGTDFL